MKETTGLMVYRAACLALVGLSVGLLDFVFQARRAWYPCYEEKILEQMRRIEMAAARPAKTRAVATGKHRKTKAVRGKARKGCEVRS